MKHKLALMLTLIGLTAVFGAVNAQNQPAVPFRGLAPQAGIDIGAAVALQPLQNDPQYAATLTREFNLIVPENALKFGPLSPSRGKYNFSGADYMVNFAQANNMKVYGHALVWHLSNPSWVVNGGFNRDQLIIVMNEHITTVLTRYRGKIAYWDVVNEAAAPNGGYRTSFWYNTIGRDYIEMAFRAAHAADPNALLFYNDYLNESLTAKSDFIYNMVKDLKARGVPIHGVGFQMHLRLDNAPDMAKVRQNIARLEALGLQVRITEIDVEMEVGTASRQDRLNQQAKIFSDALTTCLQAVACKGFTSWGFTDRYTWNAPDTPLMFDANYQPKPAYFAMNTALVNYITGAGGQPAPQPTPMPEPTAPTLVIDVAGQPAAGQPVNVTFKLYKVENLYGLEARCQANPAVMTGKGYTAGDTFTNSNSFVVNRGYNAADGTWIIAASRLHPNPAVSGNGTAFTMSYTLSQAVAPGVNCSILAVDANGGDLPLSVVTTSTTTSAAILPSRIVNEAVPEMIVQPPVIVEPTPVVIENPAIGTISGVVAYQNSLTHAGINVRLLDAASRATLAELITNENGAYVFTDVPQGAYILQAAAPNHLAFLQNIQMAGAPLAIDPQTLLAGDTDGNGIIDLIDASLVAANFNLALPPAPINADLNSDSQVNIVDLALIGGNFGLTVPPV